MRASDFRWLFLCSAVLAVGCSDRASDGDPWQFASDTSSRPDTSDAGSTDDASAQTDAVSASDLGTPDAGSDVATGDVDVTPDVGVDMRPSDAGQDGRVTVTGWYSGAFEHSGFVADSAALEVSDDGCNPYLWAEPPDENWWASGPLVSSAHQLVEGGGTMTRMRATGTITPPGMYGHLGGYDREFTIESGELLSCEAAAVVGHCIFPRARDECVIPEIPVTNPPMKRSHLTVTYGGPANSPVSYELRVIHDEGIADGRQDVVVRWQLDGQQDTSLVRIDDLQDPRLTLEQHFFGYMEHEYSDLDGWVAYAPTGVEAWLVSISGTRDDGEPLHVWGFFEVNETIALP